MQRLASGDLEQSSPYREGKDRDPCIWGWGHCFSEFVKLLQCTTLCLLMSVVRYASRVLYNWYVWWHCYDDYSCPGPKLVACSGISGLWTTLRPAILPYFLNSTFQRLISMLWGLEKCEVGSVLSSTFIPMLVLITCFFVTQLCI